MPQASTAGGTSDARFVAKYDIDVLEFGVRNESIHAPNENVHSDEIRKLANIFYDFIKSLSAL